MIARSLGPPLGEPFADDFNFLRHALFGPGSWLDGGGASIYWRPLSRQGWYGLIGASMAERPWLTVALHLVLLGASSLLVYRAVRSVWPGPWAAAAASFPLLTESSRTFLLWPTTIQDLGALFFSALAFHEASRRSLAGAIAAVVAGLLCKETTVVTALLLPWLPLITTPERRRWILGLGSALLAWGFVYGFVLRQGHVTFQSRFEQPSTFMETLPWALRLGLRDALGLGALEGWATAPMLAGLALVLLVAAAMAARRSARRRLIKALPWIGWGVAWFIANIALLTQVFPLWGPFRVVSGGWGLGIALVAVMWAATPAILAALVAVRLLALGLSAGAPALIRQEGENAYDFSSLARLSRLSHETRKAFVSIHPTLPHHSTVAWRHRPLMAQHAFAQGQALQVWYRDTTLRWITWEDAQRDGARAPDVVVEYEPGEARQVVVLDHGAVVEYLAGDRIIADAPDSALRHFDRADQLQRDRGARVFLAGIRGKRALCHLALDHVAAASAEAESSLAVWRDSGDARYVLAVLAISEGRLAEARGQLDSLLARYPYDVSARAMLDTVRARER
ncbi:MAG TPA: hypothetical protein VFQ05_01580 [Candidatus Eisenbacteria bacterium]|nr:hypothetical protein [Candidatus Eisenbacteria bacterium]